MQQEYRDVVEVVAMMVCYLLSLLFSLLGVWWALCDLNTGLPVYETGALTAELRAHGGAGRETRTPNPFITSEVHYQLCYTSIIVTGVDRAKACCPTPHD